MIDTGDRPRPKRMRIFAYMEEHPDAKPYEVWNALRKDEPINRSYVHKNVKEWKEHVKPFAQEETKPSVKDGKTITEATSVTKSLTIDEKTKKILLKDTFESEDIQYIFDAINNLFPEKHQRPHKAMQILGKVWRKPVNKIFAEMAETNPQLLFAGGVTLLTFLPSIKGMFEDWQNKRKRKEEIVKRKKDSLEPESSKE